MPQEAQAPREPDDLDRIVASLKSRGVEFMIIGGVAVIYHSQVRATKDLDIFIRRTDENVGKTVAALEAAGFGCPELTARTFMVGKGIVLGEEPMRVDILSDIAGVRFDDAWPRCAHDYFGEIIVPFIGVEDLIKNKRAVGRPQDLVDAENLERARNQAKERRQSSGEDAGSAL